MNSISQISHSQTAWCWGCWGCWGSSTRICYTEEEHAKILRRIRKDPKGSERIRKDPKICYGCYGAHCSPPGLWLIHIDSYWFFVFAFLGGKSTILAISCNTSTIFHDLQYTLSYFINPSYTFPFAFPLWSSGARECAPLSHGRREACSDARRHAVGHLQWSWELSGNILKCCDIVPICFTTFDFGMDFESLTLFLLMMFACSITPK